MSLNRDISRLCSHDVLGVASMHGNNLYYRLPWCKAWIYPPELGCEDHIEHKVDGTVADQQQRRWTEFLGQILTNSERSIRGPRLTSRYYGHTQKEYIIMYNADASAYNRLILSMRGSHPYAIKNQWKARNVPGRGLWVPRAVSLWHKRAYVSNIKI